MNWKFWNWRRKPKIKCKFCSNEISTQDSTKYNGLCSFCHSMEVIEECQRRIADMVMSFVTFQTQALIAEEKRKKANERVKVQFD